MFFPESEPTGPPVGGRRTRPSRTLPGREPEGAGRAQARAVRGMTMELTKAARDNAIPAENRPLSHRKLPSELELDSEAGLRLSRGGPAAARPALSDGGGH